VWKGDDKEAVVMHGQSRLFGVVMRMCPRWYPQSHALLAQSNPALPPPLLSPFSSQPSNPVYPESPRVCLPACPLQRSASLLMM
jgi:hypothetical protein